MKSVLSPWPVTSPTRSDGVGTRRPSVPPVTQKNLNASEQSTCESASVRMLKKMRVYRTQTQANDAVTITDTMIAPKGRSSIEPTPTYMTISATPEAPTLASSEGQKDRCRVQ